ncbi:MAG: hypothetical protein HZC10_03970 [Nitrospirae bacterium]|nr:hypothetical protein [Nitrospirota bacterium]
MKTIFSILIAGFLCTVLLISAGCDPMCDIDNYGDVYFKNDSASSRDHYVYIDNEYIGMLTPGQDESIKVQKGGHEIIFKFSTGEAACSWNATINQCQSYDFTCSI